VTLLRFVDLLDFLVPVLLYEEFGIGLIGLERYGESCKVPGIPVTTRSGEGGLCVAVPIASNKRVF
jgi:hypothetical protein